MHLPSSHKLRPTQSLRPWSEPTPKAEAELEPAEPKTGLNRIEDHFNRWDQDHNGQISWSEMRRNVASTEVKGDEAVALASLYTLAQYDVNYRGLQRTPPISYNRLFDMYYEYDSDDVNEFEEYVPLADRYLEKYEEKLRTAPTGLFPSGIASPEAATQGTAPSCGFLATTFSELQKDPSLATRMISETENGRLSVRFPGMEQGIEVAPVTDTEKALFSTAGDNGTWITVLEKAWGSHLAGRNPLAAFEKDTDPAEAIKAWTGHDAITTEIPKEAEPQPGQPPIYLAEAAHSLEKEGTVVAWTRFKDVETDDFVSGHAYSLTSIDLDSGQLTLRNPWGKMEPVDEKGKALDGKDDGIFQISFPKFQQNFQKIARETA